MPFGIAWTDSFDEASFLAWHRAALEEWRPDDWRLELVAFAEATGAGAPSSFQGLHDLLKKDGYHVSIVQNPTTSLADDVEIGRAHV